MVPGTKIWFPFIGRADYANKTLDGMESARRAESTPSELLPQEVVGETILCPDEDAHGKMKERTLQSQLPMLAIQIRRLQIKIKLIYLQWEEQTQTRDRNLDHVSHPHAKQT